MRSQLNKRVPPLSLPEPALSRILNSSLQDEPTNLLQFPAIDQSPKLSPISPRLRRHTRSRAASLMSSSLRSFSSIRSLGGLSTKSHATSSLSHDFGAGYSPIECESPSGSFILGPPASALETLGSVARALQVGTRRRSSLRQPLMPDNEFSTTGLDFPRRSTAPGITRSSSEYFTQAEGSLLGSSRRKGKANAARLPQEGFRPGLANLSVRTGTRFAMTSPPTPSGLGHKTPLPKMDPVLAALEKSSKLKSKSACLNCGKKGDNVSCDLNFSCLVLGPNNYLAVSLLPKVRRSLVLS